MFSLTDEKIIEQVKSQNIYLRGCNYFNSNKVKDFSWDREKNIIDAEVMGNERYDVSIKLSSTGNILSYHCNCPYAEDYYGACKHIVAVLKYVQNLLEQSWQDSRFNTRYSNNILKYFQSLSSLKTELKIELTYSYIDDNSYSTNSFFEFKVGENKLYIVKDIVKLIYAIKNRDLLTFGKNFSFNPEIHRLPYKYEKSLLILGEYTDSDLNYSYGYGYNVNRSMPMSDAALKRILKVLDGETIKFSLNQNNTHNVNIVCTDIPLKFKLENSEDAIVLNLENQDDLIPLTEDMSCFYYKNQIYRISKEQQLYLEPFISQFRQKKHFVKFQNSQKQKFISTVLPSIEKIANIKVSKDLQESIVKYNLKAEIYIDTIDRNLIVKVNFIYGNIQISPFDISETNRNHDRVVIRDEIKENDILSKIETVNYTYKNDAILINTDDDIFKFVYEIIPELQNICSIYYSDSFKNINISNRKLSIGIKLENFIFEMDIEYGNIELNELIEIFDSFKLKKKYHRLKDGAFIPIESSAVKQLSDLFEYNDISIKDLKSKVVQLPISRAMYLENYLSQSKDVELDENDAFKDFIQNLKSNLEFEPPSQLANLLRPYQLIGFKWLKTLAYYGMGGILADDMGLGKTLQTIAFIKSECENKNGKSIVICPTSLVFNWIDELNRFAPDLNISAIVGNQDERLELLKNIESKDLIITSYPLIKRDIDFYKNIKFSSCFLDEAQYIKNPESLNSKCVKKIDAKNRFALTGTPIENSLTEIWSIFDFIMPGYLFSHYKFSKKYEKPIIKENDENTLEQLKLMIKPFVLRRMKKDVLTELPEKIETYMFANMTEEQNKIYKSYMFNIRNQIAQEIENNGIERSKIKIIAALTRLRQICCHPAVFVENYTGDSGKMELLSEIVQNAVESKHRIIIFSQFTSMLEIIEDKLQNLDIDYFYLDGSTESELRMEYVKRFNSGENDLFLISLKAGGTGLNLTGADMVIHFDPWWNPAVEEQATDRVYRIGQKNVVQVIKLITKDTIEENIYMLQNKKRELVDSIIKPGETFINKMDEDEIKNLFKL